MLKKVPHTYTIVFSIIIICAILTWIIPGGEYARETVDVNGCLLYTSDAADD